MAVEVMAINGYKKSLIGTNDERLALSKSGVHPGTTFYCWDTKVGWIFASGDWRDL